MSVFYWWDETVTNRRCQPLVRGGVRSHANLVPTRYNSGISMVRQSDGRPRETLAYRGSIPQDLLCRVQRIFEYMVPSAQIAKVGYWPTWRERMFGEPFDQTVTIHGQMPGRHEKHST